MALAPESDQFKFWLGNWETEMTSLPDFSVKRTGNDKVRSLLKGRLIEEVFTRDDGGEKFQRGYLTYLARDKQWQHIIYDAKWGEYRFVGGKQGDKFVLESPADDTRPLKHRETFYDISPDAFNYKWESSQDDGKTWKDIWKVKYKRAAPKQELSEELSIHVVHLAETIGERNLGKYKNLCKAADYVKGQLRGFGYETSEQKFVVRGLDCFNVIAELKGSKRPNEILIIGAHYDSVTGTPGANDNGSGVAAMLALAKMFSKSKLDRTIRFIGFTNEEPPYFQNPGEMGSSVYAKKCRAADENITGILSLETMGYFSNAENSQKYPAPLNLMYPSTGNFIGFVANLESRELLDRVVKSFREQAKIPSESACLPGAVEGVGWSDHWSFWQEGYVGIMVTDTAPFRYPHYHLKTDTPDKIDFDSLAKVVKGLEHTVKDLATLRPNPQPKKDAVEPKKKSQ